MHNNQIRRIALVLPPTKHKPLPLFDFSQKSPLDNFATIATLLLQKGYDVKIFDLRWQEFNINQLSNLLANNFDCVGITTTSDSFLFIKTLSELIKKGNKHSIIVLGGSLVTSAPETILSNTVADYAVVGEGEASFLKLLDALESGLSIEYVKGICFKNENRIIFTGNQPQIRSLDTLPIPDLSIWPSISKNQVEGMYYSSSRGCPFNCSFCFKTIPYLSLKSPKRIAKELRKFRDDYNIRYVHFTDLTFDFSKKRLADISNIMRDLNTEWAAMLRVDGIDRKILQVMKNSGCDIARFGVESYSQETLDKNNKRITLKQIDYAIDSALDSGMIVVAWFIIGLPGETEKSLEATINYALKKDIIPRVHFLIPLPKTAVVSEFFRKGYFKNELELLEFLSKQGYGDDLLNITNIPDEKLISAYKTLEKLSVERIKSIHAYV